METRDLPSGLGAAADQLRQAYGQIPLSFEANQGQAAAPVQFLAHGQGYGLFLTATDAVLALSRPAHPGAPSAETVDSTLHIRLVGASAAPQVTGVDRLAGVSNYFLGSDPRRWHADIPTYAQVAYRDVYPGIDLVYYGNQQQLEYDFNLAPGANPGAVRLAFDGAQGVALDDQGDLVVQLPGGAVLEHAPVLYQLGPDGRQPVAGHYVITGDRQVGFALGAYDPSRPLVIDPTLAYSTYLGGSFNDAGEGIVVDAAGNAYITGYTYSGDFPTTSGALQTSLTGGRNAFVTRLNTTGTALVYSTYLGGSYTDFGAALAVDGSGNAYITGNTNSPDFPTTSTAYQKNLTGSSNAFVTKLNATGTALVYSTYLGGSGSDEATAIALDRSGNAYVTGDTVSTDFPTTAGALQATGAASGLPTGFVTKLNAGGTGLAYSTYLGGSQIDNPKGLAVDASGNAYVTGYTSSPDFPTTSGAYQETAPGPNTGFVTKLNAGGTGLAYSTYLGGNNYDFGSAITLDDAGNAYVVGSTSSFNFPTTTGAYQRGLRGSFNSFVTKVNASGSGVGFSTFLGGSGEDHAQGVVLDDLGNVYVAGYTTSTDFPTTASATQKTLKSTSNAYVAKFNPNGTALVYASYFGGSGVDRALGIGVDGFGSIYLTGYTSSADFPVSAGAFQATLNGGANAFVTKFAFPTARFQVSPPASSAAGTAFTITVTAQDDTNSLVRFYTGTIHFTSNDPQAVLPADYTFTSADRGVHTFSVTLKTAGSMTITATDRASGSVTGTGTLTITPLAPVAITAGGFPSPVIAGAASNLTVSARDIYGNVATSYTGAVRFATSDGQGVMPADYTFVAGDRGVHTFSVTLKTVGTQSVTVTDKANTSFTSTQSGITVNPAAASVLLLGGFPASVTAGTAGSLTITLKDPYGNLATTYTGTVHFTSSDAQAALPTDYTFTAADRGVHTFSATLKTAGAQSISAADRANGAVTGTQSGVTVNPAAASALGVAGFPSPATAGTALTFTVTAKDAYGNTAPTYLGSVHFTSSDGQAALPADYTFTAADRGVHTFSATLKTAGTQSLTATDTATGSITASQTGITVNPAAASRLVVAGFPVSITAGTAGNVTVTARDPYNNVATGYTGTVHFTSSDGQAALPADYAFGAGDRGVHTFSASLKTAGSQSLTTTDKVTGSITGAQTGITVNPAAANTLLLGGLPSPATAGVAGNATVTLKDPYGNVATGYTGTVHFTSSDAQAALPADYTFVAGDRGVHAFSVALKTAGSQSLTATDKTTSTITATQSGIVVTPAAPSSFVVGGFPTTINAGTPGTFTVTGKDAYGNTTTNFAGRVHFASSDPQAVLPADAPLANGTGSFTATLKTAGSQSITAADAANSAARGSQSGITVNPVATSTLSVRGFPSPATAGAAATFTVAATDQYGNTTPGYTGAVHFTSSDAQAVLPADYTFTAADRGVHSFSATFKTAGVQSLTAADQGNTNFRGTQAGINVVAAAANTLLLGGFPATVTAGAPGNVTITLKDQFGNVATGYTGKVHFTSSDPQAALPADYTFTAADAGVHTFSVALKTAGTQSIRGTDTTNAALTATQSGISVNPAATSTYLVAGFPSPISAGTAGNFTVTAKDQYGNTTPAYGGTVRFGSSDPQAVLPASAPLTNGTASFSATLKTAGSQSITVTDTTTGSIAGAQTGITVNAVAASSIVLAGFPGSVTAGVAATFTVTAKDQYGNTAPSYTGTLHFTSSDGQAALPADSRLTNGTGTFTATLKTAGTQSLTATDTVNSTFRSTQSGIVVSPAAPSTFVVAGFPATVTAGAAGTFTVTGRDAYGNTTTNFAGRVHFASSDPQAVLPADAPLGRGTGTFMATLKTAGSQSITAADAANSAAKGTQSGITVNPAATSVLVVAGFPTSVTAGTAGSFTVTAKDAYGNTTPTYAGTVRFSSSDGQAVLPGNARLTNGTASFSATLKTAGAQSITATDITTGSITGAQSGITVNPAAASALLLAGFPSTVTAGTVGSITVTLKDPYGNVATGYTGTVHFTSSDGQATLPADYAFGAGDRGVHTFSASLKTAGTQSLTATDKINAALTATQPGIAVNPAATSTYVVAGFPSPIAAGRPGTVRVTAKDPYGNTTPAYRGTVHFTSTDPQAVLPVDYTFTAADQGVYIDAAELLTAGTQSIIATDKVTQIIRGAQTGIVVTPLAATSIVVSGFPSPATAGAAGTFTVTAKDQYGNTAPSYTGTVHFTSSDPQAVLPADARLTNGTGTFTATLKTAGSQSITATDTANSNFQSTQTFTVNPAAPSTFVVTGFPATVTAGAAGTFTVTGKDAYGNTTTNFAGRVHFTSSDPQAVLPADAPLSNGSGSFTATLKTAGSQSITAADAANSAAKGTQSGITVNPAATSRLLVAGFPASVTAGTAGTFSVTAQDAYGNTTPTYAGTVRFSSSDAQAVLPGNARLTNGTASFSATLKTAGAQSITATDTVSSAITGAQTGITVNPAVGASLVVAGFPTSITAGTAGTFTVTAKDAYGNTTPTYAGTVRFSSSDGQAVLPGNARLTNGTASFSATLKTAGAQSITATDTTTGSITGTQTGITVNPAAAARLAAAGFPATVTAGVAGNVTITAKDAFGNTAPSYRGTVHLTSSDAQATLPADYTFTAADNGVHTFSATLKTAGTQSLTATDKATGSITGAQTGITVNPAAAASLAVAGFPGTVTAGVAGNVTVTAKDAFGNTATGYTGTVHFTSSDAQAALPTDYAFAAADRGVHTFSVTLKTAGTQSLTATDKATGSITGTQTGITVNPAAVSKLAVAGFPASITAGTAGNVTVTAKDAFGNTTPGYTGTVHFTSSDAQAVLPADYTFTAADRGVHAFSATLKTAGTQSLTATDKTTGSITGAQTGITVNPAVAAGMVVAGFPSPTTAGAPGNVTVTLKDAYGNTAAGYTGTVHFTSSDAQAVLPADYAFRTADAGVHTFSVTFKTVGTQSLTATDTANGALRNTQAGIVVNPATASDFVVSSFPTSITAGVAGNVTVTARDASGNTATGYIGTVHFTSSDAQAALPADYTFTAADRGVHTFSATLKTAGTQSITATDRAIGTITGTQTGITVNPAAAARLAVAGFPAMVTAGVAGSVTVTAKDTFGNTAPSYTGTVHFTSSDAQAVLPGDYAFGAGDRGVHTFSASLKTAGTQSLTATDTTTATVTGTQTGITVNPAAAASLIVAGFPGTITAGVAGNVTVTAKDAFGNVATGYTGTVRFTSSDAQAALPTDYAFAAADNGVHTFSATLKTVGTQSLTVTDKTTATITGTQTGIVVNPAAAATLAVAGFPGTITAGTGGNVTITAKDAFGNVATGYTGTIHFTSSDAQAVLPTDYAFGAGDRGVHTFSATLKTAGAQSLTATDTATGSITGAQTGITVNPAAAVSLTAAGFPTSITAGMAANVTVTAKDAYNNIATGYTGTVRFSSSDGQAALPADYTFTAAEAGVHTFSATLKTVGTQSLTATDKITGTITGTQSGILVNPAAAARLGVSAPAATTAGTAFSLTVTALDAYGNTATGYTGTATFTSTDANATLPPDYTFTAGDAGVHTFTGVVLRTAGTRFLLAYDTTTGTLSGFAPVTVAAAAADHSTVRTSAASPQVAGTPFDVTVTLLDVYGNRATGYTGTVTFSSGDPQAALPADYAFTAGDAGVHTFAGGATLKTAGTWDVTATDSANQGVTGTAEVTVIPAAADHFQVTTSVDGGSTVAGTPFDVTVTVQDPYGNMIADYAGTVHFSSQDPYGAILSDDYTFTTGDGGDNGVHTFAAGATLFTAGTQDVTATDADTGLAGSANVTVVAAAADHFRVTTSVDTAVAGTPFDVTVTVQDVYGNTVTDYAGTVHFSSADPYGALLPDDYTFTADDAGVHTFADGATLFTAGTWDVTATDADTGLTGSVAVTVVAAAADHFQILVPDASTAGQAFDVTVIALDPYGNIDANYQGTVHFGSTDPKAALPDDYTFTADDGGVHTFAGGVTLFTAGSQDITATDTDSGITGSSTVLVTAAAADHFMVVVSSPVTSGMPFDVTILALDPYGNVDRNYQGTVHFSTTDEDPGVVLPEDYTFTADDEGVHTFTMTLITTGEQTITVTDTDSGISGSAPVTVEDVGPEVALSSGRGAAAAPPPVAGTSRPGPDRAGVTPAAALDVYFQRAGRHSHAAGWLEELLPPWMD